MTDRFLLPKDATISVIDLCRKFQPNPSGSLNALLTLMNVIADVVDSFDKRAAAVILGSAMPAIKASMGVHAKDLLLLRTTLLRSPPRRHLNSALFDPEKDYGIANLPLQRFYTLSSSSLAMMAYNDFFPNDDRTLFAQFRLVLSALFRPLRLAAPAKRLEIIYATLST